MPSLLQIQYLSVGYKQKTLLRDISFEINRGEIVALVGRNGTGKTTLLRTLSGLQDPMQGKVLIEGKELHHLKPRERAKLVSIVLTHRIVLQGIDVRTLLEMGRYPAMHAFPFLKNNNAADDAQLIDACLHKLNITHLADKPLAEISDGELQKAMIARSLVQQTPLILMDEPTAFLDYVAKEELFEQLKRLAVEENIAILFSSHDLELVKKYADKVVQVEEGGCIIKNILEKSF